LAALPLTGVIRFPTCNRTGSSKRVVNNVTKFVDIVVNQDGFDHTPELTTTTKFLTKSRIEQIDNLNVFGTDTTPPVGRVSSPRAREVHFLFPVAKH
jgi:hypothetical protein